MDDSQQRGALRRNCFALGVTLAVGKWHKWEELKLCHREQCEDGERLDMHDLVHSVGSCSYLGKRRSPHDQMEQQDDTLAVAGRLACVLASCCENLRPPRRCSPWNTS